MKFLPTLTVAGRRTGGGPPTNCSHRPPRRAPDGYGPGGAAGELVDAQSRSVNRGLLRHWTSATDPRNARGQRGHCSRGMAGANETRHCAWLTGMRLVRPPTWCSHLPREQCEETALRLGDSRFSPCVLTASGGRCVSAWPGGIRCASTPGSFACSTCARPSAQLVREARHAIERRQCTWGARSVDLWLLGEPRGSQA